MKCSRCGHINGDLPRVVDKGRRDLAEILLAKGADVNKLDNLCDKTALMLAILHKNADIAELLLANKADVEAADPYGMTSLCFAVWWRKKDFVALLLAHRANVHTRNKFRWTPLHFAAENYRGEENADRDIAALLIAHGADVNARNELGRTPLHFAATGGRKEIAALLLSHGASVNVRANDGRTPLDIAAAEPHDQEMVDLLLTHGADSTLPNQGDRDEDYFYYKGNWVARSVLDAEGIPHSKQGKSLEELRRSGSV
jgi:ankyrin repeat protein